MQQNNPGRIVDTRQIIAGQACFYPAFGLYYVNCCEAPSKKFPFGSECNQICEFLNTLNLYLNHT